MRNDLNKMAFMLKNGALMRAPFICRKNNKDSNRKLLDTLWNEGFILGYKICKTKREFYTFRVFLKYQRSDSVINSVKSVSKPGLKVYCSLKQLWKLNLIRGLIIISTNKGLKTLTECKKIKLGGELLFLIK